MQHQKRQHRSRQEWQSLIDQHQQSGLSAAQFCKEQHIPYASFCNWKRRLQADANGITNETASSDFIDLSSLSPSANHGWRITLKLGNGVELELSQP